MKPPESVRNSSADDERDLSSKREELLLQIEGWLEIPMLVLGFAWLALLVVELVWRLNPLLETLGTVIWIIFIIDFALEFTIAPGKLAYLKRNWLTALSLLVPALRVFRFLRVLRLARAGRGFRLFRIVSSVNRGLRALGANMSRRGFGYMIALTLLVTLTGSAGMYAFENDLPGGRGLNSFGTALWWTAMLMTTMGSDYWPQTPEGRVLCLLLALYAFAVFGYVTAALASFFVGRDAQDKDGPIAGTAQIDRLAAEIAALRLQISDLSNRKPTA